MSIQNKLLVNTALVAAQKCIYNKNKAYLRFATGDDTIWNLKKYWDWKEYRLNPLTGEKK